MSEPLSVTVISTDQKMGYRAVTRDNEEIAIDYIPPYGEGNGYMPLELFLISLSACSSSSVALLLRKMRKTVTSIQVSANGTRREQHPTSFSHIELSFTIESPDAINEDVDKAIKASEDTICPVWAMIKGNVEVSTTYEIK